MSHELPSFLIDAGELLQHVSRVVYRGSPLYFGGSGTSRYEDIDLVDHVDWQSFVATYRISVEPDPGSVESRRTKRPEAARMRIEDSNRMNWSKLE